MLNSLLAISAISSLYRILYSFALKEEITVVRSGLLHAIEKFNSGNVHQISVL